VKIVVVPQDSHSYAAYIVIEEHEGASPSRVGREPLFTAAKSEDAEILSQMYVAFNEVREMVSLEAAVGRVLGSGAK
jgi:hypothetical protein